MVIRAADVSRRYGETVALDGVSLTVEAGEVFALLGPNGAGKTTLIRALTGTTDAEGTVELFGQPPRAVARHRLGVLPQSFSPAARLTARELVRYYAGLYDGARDPASVLRDVGLVDAGDTHYEDLSGGEKRRTCVATALVNDPDLLVLDEPTTGVDPAGRRDIRSLIAELADGGTTVLLTTHYVAEAEALADTVGLLADGRLVGVGPPATLVAEHGGESRLAVEIRDSAGRADAAAALEEAGFPVHEDESGVTVDAAREDVAGVVEALSTVGIAYDGLRWRRPSLEDVYLALTGDAAGPTPPGAATTDRVADTTVRSEAGDEAAVAGEGDAATGEREAAGSEAAGGEGAGEEGGR